MGKRFSQTMLTLCITALVCAASVLLFYSQRLIQRKSIPEVFMMLLLVTKMAES